METVQIGVGIAIIIFTFLDFFHSTLSGNGFGYSSGILNRFLNRVLLQNRGRGIFNFSGLIHLLVTTFFWLFALFCGAYIIFTSGEEMVINATTHLPANYTERFYFTCYLLSTLGIGDFIPGNKTSEILAGLLSFTGFILITTGMTYLLSVVQAVLSKKQLAFLISTMGQDVDEIYHFFKKQDDLSGLVSDASDLRQQILENASSYLSFPMVNFFLTKDKKSALVVQLARLYEVLQVIKMDWGEGTIQNAKICVVLNSIEKYLELGLEGPDAAPHNEEQLRTLRSYWKEYNYNYQKQTWVDRQFSSSLSYAGWSWKEVYKYKDQK